MSRARVSEEGAKRSYQLGEYLEAASAFDGLLEENASDDADHRFRLLCNASAAWLRSGDKEKALVRAEEALKLETRRSKAYFRRGEAWFALQDYDRALRDFRAAKDLANGEDETLEKRIMAAQEALELHTSMKEMEQELKDMRTGSEGTSEAGEERKTVEELTRDAEDRERDPKVRNLLKQAEHQAEAFHIEEAAMLFEEAFSADKTCTEAMTRASAIYFSLGQDQKAMKCAEAAIRADIRSVAAHIILGSIFERMGKTELAEPLFMKAVGMAFDFPETHVRLAQNLIQQGKVRLAAEVLRFAIAGGPEGKMLKPGMDPKVRFTMAYVQALRGYTAEPITLFSELLQDAPSPACAYMLSRCLMYAGDEAQAKSTIEYMEMMEKVAPAYFHLDMAWLINTCDLPCWDRLTNRMSLCMLFRHHLPNRSCMPPAFALPDESNRWKELGDTDSGQWAVRNPYQVGQAQFHCVSGASENIPAHACLLQKYVSDCICIERKKVTFGVFVVIVSSEPLEAYLLKEGLVYLSNQDSLRSNPQASLSTRSRGAEHISQSKWELQQKANQQLQQWAKQGELYDSSSQPTQELSSMAHEFKQEDGAPAALGGLRTLQQIRSISDVKEQIHNWEEIWSVMVECAKLFAELCKIVTQEPCEELRPKYHSYLRIPKIIELEYAVDEASKPWLLGAERFPILEGRGISFQIRQATVSAAMQLASMDLPGHPSSLPPGTVALHTQTDGEGQDPQEHSLRTSEANQPSLEMDT